MITTTMTKIKNMVFQKNKSQIKLTIGESYGNEGTENDQKSGDEI